MTRLSVVVPCYNVSAYVAQTVCSLRRSAAPGIEFLLVDDHSEDDTLTVLRSEAERLPGARVVALPSNVGLAGARNRGLDAARGDYVTFLDGDDFVAPGYYPELLATIERLGCDMLRTDHVQVKGRERAVHRIAHGPRGVVSRPRDSMLPAGRRTSVDAPYAWAGAFSRRLLDDGLLYFSESLRTCEDRPWIWRLHLQAESFAVVGLTGLRYRRGVPTSLTQLADERQFDFVPAYNQIIADTERDRDAELLMPKAVRSYCAIVLHHLNQLDRYEPQLRDRLSLLCRHALLALPTTTVTDVVAGFEPDRADRLRSLLVAP